MYSRARLAADSGTRPVTGATMPAVLVEVGFLSNTDEAALLASPDHQQRLAEAIARGIGTFLDGS